VRPKCDLEARSKLGPRLGGKHDANPAPKLDAEFGGKVDDINPGAKLSSRPSQKTQAGPGSMLTWCSKSHPKQLTVPKSVSARAEVAMSMPSATPEPAAVSRPSPRASSGSDRPTPYSKDDIEVARLVRRSRQSSVTLGSNAEEAAPRPSTAKLSVTPGMGSVYRTLTPRPAPNMAQPVTKASSSDAKHLVVKLRPIPKRQAAFRPGSAPARPSDVKSHLASAPWRGSVAVAQKTEEHLVPLHSGLGQIIKSLLR